MAQKRRAGGNFGAKQEKTTMTTPSDPVRLVELAQTVTGQAVADDSLPVVLASDQPPIDTQAHGEIDANNSSTLVLGAGGVFTGVSTDISHAAIFFVNVYSDVASAIDGLSIEQSSDGVNWYYIDKYTIPAGVGKTFSFQPSSPYLRIQYTNGTTPQAAFDLAVMLKSANSKPSSHRIADAISDDDAELVKSVLTGQNPAGTFVNVQTTTEGELKSSVVSPTGVLPVSQLTTLHDGKILNRLYPEINEIVGTGTAVLDSNKMNMTVTAGQWNVIQTRRFMPYYSGKPQKVELTFDNFAPQADVVKRVGYFSSGTVSPYDTVYDGFYLESGAGTIRFVAVRAGVTTIDVDITAWNNYARLGNYQNLATWDNFTVIEFNFLWLGGAYIELRLVGAGGFITAHNLVYAGTSQDVFIKSPNQPVRYEIRSTTGSGSFRYVCNQVATSGAISESARGLGVDTGVTPLTLAAIGTTYPVLGIKKGASYRDNAIRISNLALFITSNDRALWSLQVNPTLSAGLTYNPVSGTSIETAVGNGIITVSTPGYAVAKGFVTNDSNIDPVLFDENFLAWLSGSIAGTQDAYVLCATPITSNVTAFGAANLLEA